MLVLLVVLPAACWFAGWMRARHAERELARDVERARECVLGGALAAGEVPSRRFRVRQLEALAVSDPGLVVGERWPHRCAPLLEDITKQLEVGVDVSGHVRTLARRLTEAPAELEDLGPEVDATFALLQRIHPAPGGAEALREPPTLDAFGAPTPFELSSLQRENFPGDRLRVSFGNHSCELDPDQPTVACRKMGPVWSPVTWPLAGTSEDGAHLWFEISRDGVTRGDVKDPYDFVLHSASEVRVDHFFTQSGVAHADGSISVIGYADRYGPLQLVHASRERARSVPIPRRADVLRLSEGSVLWEDIVLLAETSNHRRELVAIRVEDALARNAAYRTVPIQPRDSLTACRSEGITAVRIADQLALRQQNGDYLAMTGVWPGLLHQAKLGCHHGKASLVGFASAVVGSLDRRVVHTTCGLESGCRSQAVEVGSLVHGHVHAVQVDVEVADFDGKLLAVWRSKPRSGLRLRLSAPEAFEEAPELLVLDEHRRGDTRVPEPSYSAFELVTGPGVAALLLQSADGLRVLRVLPDGTVRPWPVRVMDADAKAP